MHVLLQTDESVTANQTTDHGSQKCERPGCRAHVPIDRCVSGSIYSGPIAAARKEPTGHVEKHL